MSAAHLPLLLLFDIDGTLVSGAAEAHRRALHAALRAVHGVDPDALGTVVEPAGRTDGEIARLLLIGAGVPARQIDERARDVQVETSRRYAELGPADLSETVLPGVRELLGWLREREDVELTLVTGNYEAVARIKLRRAGLGDHFPAHRGAFGSDSEDRAALPALARRRASRTSDGRPHPRERTIVIGDTPRDVACARADELRCLAVATGPFDVRRLAEAQADGVAADAFALRELLEPLLAPQR